VKISRLGGGGVKYKQEKSPHTGPEKNCRRGKSNWDNKRRPCGIHEKGFENVPVIIKREGGQSFEKPGVGGKNYKKGLEDIFQGSG